MDYDELANELVRNMQRVRIASHKGHIPESTRGENLVLHFIKASHGKVVPGDISDAIGVSSARIATALNSLENKELVTRRIDSEDRRQIIVELTPKGAETVNEQQEMITEKLKKILVSLGEEDARELVRLTGRLLEVLSEDPGTCDRRHGGGQG